MGLSRPFSLRYHSEKKVDRPQMLSISTIARVIVNASRAVSVPTSFDTGHFPSIIPKHVNHLWV